MIINFEKAHNCKESHGKIILIEIDKLGNTHCGYCHKVVKYNFTKEKK